MSIRKFDFTYDLAFKSLIRDEKSRDALIYFLSILACVPESILKDMRIEGGELPKKSLFEKGNIADILIFVDKIDTIYILEMNRQYSKNLWKKNKRYQQKISSEGTYKVKRQYHYKNVVLININNFNYFHTKLPIQYFCSVDKEGRDEDKDLKYHTIHLILDNVIDIRYNKDIDEFIIKFAKILKAKNLKEVKKCAEGDEKLMKLFEVIKRLTTRKKRIGYYNFYEQLEQDKLDFKETGKEEGIEIGREQGIGIGREQEQARIAQNLSKTMSSSEISKILEINEANVKVLLEAK